MKRLLAVLSTVTIVFLLASCAGAKTKSISITDKTSSTSTAPRPEIVRSERNSASRDEHLKFGYPSHETVLYRVGYVLSHNNLDKIPAWVSYHLTAAYVDGTEARTDDFRPDEDLSAEERAELSDYRGSGYDRGHMAPAADMRGRGTQVVSESFLLSNMTPQIPAFNRGIWSRLESIVRKWAKSREEVWVITGPLFLDEDDNGNIQYEVIGVNEVAVPPYFFKIIVSQVQGQTPEVIAFVLANRGSRRPLEDFLVSIDFIEEQTGLNFLDVLPDPIESQIESQRVVGLWSIGN